MPVPGGICSGVAVRMIRGRPVMRLIGVVIILRAVVHLRAIVGRTILAGRRVIVSRVAVARRSRLVLRVGGVVLIALRGGGVVSVRCAVRGVGRCGVVRLVVNRSGMGFAVCGVQVSRVSGRSGVVAVRSVVGRSGVIDVGVVLRVKPRRIAVLDVAARVVVGSVDGVRTPGEVFLKKVVPEVHARQRDDQRDDRPRPAAVTRGPFHITLVFRSHRNAPFPAKKP